MSKKTMVISGIFGEDLREKDTLILAFARIHAISVFLKNAVFELPVKAICGLILLALLVMNVIIEHIRWEYSYWTGWKDEAAFWFNGAFALFCLLLFLPVQLLQTLIALPKQ